MRWILLTLIGCGSAGDPVDPCEASTPMLVAATTDFQVGVLAALDPAADCVADRLATLGPDPVVVAEDGVLWQLNRSAGDTLRRYEPGAWDAPEWEVALEAGANAHGLVRVDDTLVIPRYDLPQLALRSAVDGTWIDAIDLSAHADADGLPEADGAVIVDGRVFVALQRFDRSAGWLSVDGRVVEVDPGSRTVVASWEVGPSPRVFSHPAEAGSLIVITGVYGAADGEVEVLDVVSGARRTVVREADVGLDLATYAEHDGVGVLLGTDLAGEGRASVHCVDWPDALLREGPEEEGWFIDAIAGSDAVWIAARRGWSAGGNPGLFALDVARCDAVGDRQRTAFEPYSLAWVD